MSDKLKIKLSIADRVYPLTIQSEQEEGLRKAAKKIEAMIKQFEQSYAVRDKQDVLAMCALQFAAQTEQKSIENNSDVELMEKKLRALNNLLQAQLAT
ncbi:MAG TPA: cell division protein ZapA [Gillisia sp.]|nr:cell division protein ZapA [Gillisia sp.]